MYVRYLKIPCFSIKHDAFISLSMYHIPCNGPAFWPRMSNTVRMFELVWRRLSELLTASLNKLTINIRYRVHVEIYFLSIFRRVYRILKIHILASAVCLSVWTDCRTLQGAESTGLSVCPHGTIRILLAIFI